MARTTWRELGPRKSALIFGAIGFEMLAVIVIEAYIAHLTEAQAIPLGWLLLAFAGLMWIVLLLASSIPLITSSVFLGFVPLALVMYIVTHWNLFGYPWVGDIAFILIVAATVAYKQTHMLRRQAKQDTEADD